MNNTVHIEVKGTQEFLGKEIPVIEGGFGECEKVVLAKTIAEIHGVDLKRVNELITNNLDEFEEGVDILDLMNEDFKVVATDLGFITSNGQKYCYLLSEQGYHALVSLMRTDKAKELRKQFRREYFAMRKVIKEQEPMCMEDVIIYQMQQMKSMREKLNQVNNEVIKVNQIATDAQKQAQSIKDVVSLDTSKWRSDTQRMIMQIAKAQEDAKYIGQIRNESYELLNKRFGVSLEKRLINKRRRMADEGVSKSNRDKLNFLDVIADDKKLIEGYVIVVKDMAIKYGI